MMNINLEKEVNSIEGTKHEYLWDESWIRPYESPISAYMNFCSINAFSYKNLRLLWNCNQTCCSNQIFDHEINYYIGSPLGFREKIKEVVYPPKYQIFPQIEGDIGYITTFRYCKKCIKQGYHSLLSQIPSERICPIHNTKYIDTFRRLTIGMAGDYKVYKELLGDFPLPPEREELDYSKIGDRLREIYHNSNLIGYLIPAGISSDGNAFRISLSLYDRREEIAHIDSSFDYNQYVEYVWDYLQKSFSAVHTPETLRLEEDYLLLHTLDHFFEYSKNAVSRQHGGLGAYLSKTMILACIADYIKDIDKSLYPFGAYPHFFFPVNSICEADDTYNMKMSYCFAVRGCQVIDETMSMDFLSHSRASATLNTCYTYNTYLAYIIDSTKKLKNLFINLDLNERNLRKPVLEAMIIYDHFWYQSKLYEEDIRNRGSFNFYKECRNIPPLIYEIDQTGDNEIYLYRLSRNNW